MNRNVLSLLALGAAAVVSTAAASEALPPQIDLDSAIALALEHNYAIRQARARYAEATGALDESRAARLPTVSASAGYTEVDRSLIESPGVSSKSWDAGVQAQQNLYAGGAITAGIRASRANLESSAASFESVVQNILFDVQQRFLAVLVAREQVGVQEQSVQLLQEELGTATARVEAGTGSPFEQLRAEVALANGQPPLIRARNQYRLTTVELFQTIGVTAEEGVEDRIAGSLEFDGQPFTLESLLASARNKRPEIRELEQAVTAAEEAVAIARAGARPAVGAFAGYGVQRSSQAHPTDETLDGWNIGLQGSWAIFDGNATRARVAQARSRLEQARLGLDETLLGIDAEVRQAWSSYREAEELVKSSQRVVEQAEEALRLARSRFDVGAATQLDVLQVQVALTEARTNEASALYSANVALAFLQRAAGLMTMPAGVTVRPAREK